jgi:4-diphosphocytidyl-2-C-methyl-D-erythritol kinase
MSALLARAPAKVNLCLLVGPVRAQDGRHELVSVMDTVSLADELVLEPLEGDGADRGDEVVCPGVEGPNLVAAAIAAFREATAWGGPPVRITATKRIPVAGGMAGGSADAAAALRLLAAHAGTGDPGLLESIAARLGADVPSQIRGGRVLASGAGERLEPAAAGGAYGVLVLPVEAALPTALVFEEADRLGGLRTLAALEDARERLRHEDVLAGLVTNDLAPPARALCPAIDLALADAAAAGADEVIVSGSGPTVLGLFAGADGPGRARAAAAELAGRRPQPVAAEPVPAGWGEVTVSALRHTGEVIS